MRAECYSFLQQQNMFFARSIHCACCWNIYIIEFSKKVGALCRIGIYCEQIYQVLIIREVTDHAPTRPLHGLRSLPSDFSFLFSRSRV